MQQDLDANHPELQIQLVGVNRIGTEFGNTRATDGKDIPWLQDVDQDGDGRSDVWTDWEVVWRDVFIVDPAGEVVDIISLTVNDLRRTDNYDELKGLLIETAESAPPAPVEEIAGDCSGDNVLDASDLVCVSDIQERDVVLDSIDSLPGDLDGDGMVAFSDFLILSNNFGTDETSYSEGNIDLQGGVDFADFLALSNNFGQSTQAADAVFDDWA